MKKNYLKLISSVLLAALFITGCEKEPNEIISDTDLQSFKSNQKNECRLTNFTYPDGEYNYHYNRKGLADEWDITNYSLFKQEYDKNGRLKISRQYDGTELLSTIHFFYEKNRVVKEIWYNGNTSEIGDEIFYTYNRKGKMVRMESFMNDYYTIATFTPEGNTESWKFYLGGSPFYEGYLKHTRPFKNPYLAVNGIEHGFPFINPSYNSDKWFAASEKLIIYDENGEPIVLHDFDPSQTIWQRGNQNYPLSATYFDVESESWFPYTFEYENCGRHNDHDNSQTVAAPASSVGTKKINPMMLLKHHPSKSIKEQVKEIRRQVSEMKRNK